MRGPLDLPVVDGLALGAEHREVLRPGETVTDGNGWSRDLPRWFYEVDSWQTARDTALSEHFTLHEFITVDVREAPVIRSWPRYVPCGITLLVPHLELVRVAAGGLTWVAANGGYRSPGHGVGGQTSPHCWGTAANVYRVGDDLLDSQERIDSFRELVGRVAPGLWVRPWGHGKGTADDHVHLDIGYPVWEPRPGWVGTGRPSDG